jgi:hypothetical protein
MSSTNLDGTPLVPDMGNRGGSRDVWPAPSSPVSISQYEPVETEDIYPSYQFKIERNAQTATIQSVMAHAPDRDSICDVEGPLKSSCIVGNHISKREPLGRDGRYVIVKRTKYQIVAIRRDGKQLVVDLKNTTEGSPIASEDCPEQQPEDVSLTISAARLLESLADCSESSTWTHRTAWIQTIRDTPYIPAGSAYEPVESCSDLSFRTISGSGARSEVNAFLEGGPDGAVQHELGEITNGWKQAFGAYDSSGRPIGMIVLDRHSNHDYFQEHNELTISRLACHPARPHNCSSWMIARARNWAREQGFAQLGAIAGVGENRGVSYEAAGFELDNCEWADGSGWTNRSGRSNVQDGKLWWKRKWVCSL